MGDTFRIQFTLFEGGLEWAQIPPGLRALAAHMPPELTELPLFVDPPGPGL